jgi:DNA polymerase III delta prime subunit
VNNVTEPREIVGGESHGEDDLQAVVELEKARARIVAELSKVVVGQQEVIEQLLISMFARGHCLLVGVPGLAKTLLIRTLASALSCKFQSNSVHSGFDAGRHHGDGSDSGRPSHGQREYRFFRVPFSPTSFWRTRSIGRRRRHRRPSSKRCRNIR